MAAAFYPKPYHSICAWTDRFVRVLPDPELHIEAAKFDVQKIMNPDIQKEDYPHGPAYGFWNNRSFVFARDEYTCQICGKKKDANGSEILHTHHRVFKSQGGSDRPDNLAAVHASCHEHFHQDLKAGKEWAVKTDQKLKKKVKHFKEPPFMHAMKKAVFQRYPQAIVTYGNITQARRKELGLAKSHCNDAIAISGIQNIQSNLDEWIKVIQIRKKKRSLHEANPRKGKKTKNTESRRNSKNTKQVKNWCLGDTVLCFGQSGYISSFSGSSCCRVTNANGEYIHAPGKSYTLVSLSRLRMKKRNNNWISFRQKESAAAS